MERARNCEKVSSFVEFCRTARKNGFVSPVLVGDRGAVWSFVEWNGLRCRAFETRTEFDTYFR